MDKSSIAKGREAIESTSGGRGFTQNIYWKDGDIKTLFFTTPIEDVPETKFHLFVPTAITKSDGEEAVVTKHLMCRNTPAWLEESKGHCPLCEKGHKTTTRLATVAVELEQVIPEGRRRPTEVVPVVREVERDDGTKSKFLNAGLILQSKKLFFSHLAGLDADKWPLAETSFEVIRQGKTGSDTKYMFVPYDLVPDLSEFEDQIPDVYDLLEEMGSQEAYSQDLRPEDAQQFEDDKPASSSRTTASSDFDKLKAEVVGASA